MPGIVRGSSSANGTKNTYTQTVNLVADYGAVSGGSQATNNAAAAAFNAAFNGFSGRTQLIIPPGDYNFTTGLAASGGGSGKELVISAYGATLRNVGGFGAASQTGAGPGFVACLMQTTAAGASTVNLVTSGDTSNFSAGQWVRVTEGDVQGFGQPPNPWKFEFKKIQSIGTGTLTFTEPLQRSYSSAFPNYNAGNPGFEPYGGGPACIYGLRSTWDLKVEMKGAYIPDNNNLFYGRGRDVTYTDMYFETYGPAASDAINCTVQRCTVGTFGEMEVDKTVDTLVLRDNLFNAVVFQSLSVNNLIADNNTCRPGQYWRGSANNSVIRKLNTPTYWFGLVGYGALMGNTTLIDCNAATASYPNTYRFLYTNYTEAGGSLTISGGPVQWAVPGAWYVLLDGSGNYSGISFQVTNIVLSGGVTTISTTLSQPVPSTSGGRNAPWYIVPHPGKDTTLINCTGNSTFTTASGNPPNSPIFGWN